MQFLVDGHLPVTVNPSTTSLRRVKRVDYNHTKKLTFDDGTAIELQRFACVGPGDLVDIGQGTEHAAVALGTSRIPLRPVFSRTVSLPIATRNLSVTFKEVETDEEIEGYRRLSDYHYRGTDHHGRNIPIIAVVDYPLLPRVIAYIELATTFMMNKARTKLFSSPFTVAEQTLWMSWDLDAMKTKTNLILRIARAVVYPELRGLNLSRHLVDHAADFARERWHIAGQRPLFLEITADMLRYLPFAEKAGMHFIGLTEGNLARVSKDMRYLTRDQKRLTALRKGNVGIVRLQAGYANQIQKLLREGGRRKGKKRSLLKRLEVDESRISNRQWTLFHNVLRFPKPTYLMGLSPEAEAYVQRQVSVLNPEGLPPEPHLRLDPITQPVRVRDLTISIHSKVVESQKVRMVQRAFGLSPDRLDYNAVTGLNLEIRPGTVTLLVGPSGSGKTLLLESLTGERRIRPGKNGNRVYLDGAIDLPPNIRIGTLRPIHSQRPLVDVLGGRDAARAMFIMNMAGLSEAYLYLRRFEELSAGQKYRAMIARLLDSRCNLWIADEFCAALDPVAAFLVSQNLRRLAAKFGATLIVAAASWGDFIEALRPDLVVQLMSGREHRVIKGTEFLGSYGFPVDSLSTRAASRRPTQFPDGPIPVDSKSQSESGSIESGGVRVLCSCSHDARCPTRNL